jgi:hypothetical protein
LKLPPSRKCRLPANDGKNGVSCSPGRFQICFARHPTGCSRPLLVGLAGLGDLKAAGPEGRNPGWFWSRIMNPIIRRFCKSEPATTHYRATSGRRRSSSIQTIPGRNGLKRHYLVVTPERVMKYRTDVSGAST